MSKEYTKSVFNWDHFSLYLSGPIDFSRGASVGWRDEITIDLIEIGFKPGQIFDPCKKPLGNAPFNLDNEGEIMDRHRSKREWSELMKVMSQIVHIDLRLVDKSDLVIVHMPKYGQEIFDDDIEMFMNGYTSMLEICKHNHSAIPHLKSMHDSFFSLLKQASNHRIPTYGTVHEIVMAHLQQKPIFISWEGGKETCSAWLMYLVGHNNVFSSPQEIVTRLDNIAKGKAAYSVKEWLLLDLDRR